MYAEQRPRAIRRWLLSSSELLPERMESAHRNVGDAARGERLDRNLLYSGQRETSSLSSNKRPLVTTPQLEATRWISNGQGRREQLWSNRKGEQSKPSSAFSVSYLAGSPMLTGTQALHDERSGGGEGQDRRSAANASGRRSRGWCVEKHEVQPGPVWERRSEPARHGRSSHRVLGPLTAYTASKMRCDAMRCDAQLSCHAISERFWCAHGPPLVSFPFASSPSSHRKRIDEDEPRLGARSGTTATCSDEIAVLGSIRDPLRQQIHTSGPLKYPRLQITPRTGQRTSTEYFPSEPLLDSRRRSLEIGIRLDKQPRAAQPTSGKVLPLRLFHCSRDGHDRRQALQFRHVSASFEAVTASKRITRI
ncbi:hypothetical protein VTN00DRAFT_5641 [Thermoascus crustaceus]|uniref:uncharacterized protein n=1 Tax=Thermoascus crustaceus TaxID=5088 RepID=UPI003742E03C